MPTTSPYVFGRDELTPGFKAALNEGRVSVTEMSALLQGSWELLTQDKGSNDAILFLLGVSRGAFEALNESMAVISQQNPQLYQQLQAEQVYARADERLAPMQADPMGVYSMLLSLSGGFTKTWGQLESASGPTVLGEGENAVTFNMSPASVVQVYVAQPLLYGIWPPDWTGVMTEARGIPQLPDAALPIQIFNDRGSDDTDEAKQFMAATLSHMADAIADPSLYPGFTPVRTRETPMLRGPGGGDGGAEGGPASTPLQRIGAEFRSMATRAYNYVVGAILAPGRKRTSLLIGLAVGAGVGIIGAILLARRNN